MCNDIIIRFSNADILFFDIYVEFTILFQFKQLSRFFFASWSIVHIGYKPPLGKGYAKYYHLLAQFSVLLVKMYSPHC
jgi:hypothetical protein